jgi:hypothetical protein
VVAFSTSAREEHYRVALHAPPAVEEPAQIEKPAGEARPKRGAHAACVAMAGDKGGKEYGPREMLLNERIQISKEAGAV